MTEPTVIAALLGAIAAWSRVPEPPRRGVFRRAPATMWWARAASLPQLSGHGSATRARDIASLTSALATELRSGQPPDQAWRHVLFGATGWLPATAVVDADIVLVLRRWAGLPGWSGLDAVAVCWQLAGATGAGLADALDRIGEAMRHEHEVAAEVHGQLSSTRATAVMLATLPLVAVAMGSILGADPLGVLFGTAVGVACLALGATLTVLGWWWVGRQVAAVRETLRW